MYHCLMLHNASHPISTHITSTSQPRQIMWQWIWSYVSASARVFVFIYIYLHEQNCWVIGYAAAAKSLQSCLTLCDPIDGSPPGSPVPGILQERTLKWVAISFSSAWRWKVKVKSLSCVRLLATPWTAAHQAPLSMGFSRQEYWSGVPLPSPESQVMLLPNLTKNYQLAFGNDYHSLHFHQQLRRVLLLPHHPLRQQPPRRSWVKSMDSGPELPEFESQLW